MHALKTFGIWFAIFLVWVEPSLSHKIRDRAELGFSSAAFWCAICTFYTRYHFAILAGFFSPRRRKDIFSFDWDGMMGRGREMR